MTKFLLGDADPRDELIALLEHNAMRYIADGESVRLSFAQNGCKWETVFQFAKNTVLVYGVYPFRVHEPDMARINAINNRLVHGAMFLHEGAIVMRTGAELVDIYSAYETIARAVEYNAGAMVEFWGEVARLCTGI